MSGTQVKIYSIGGLGPMSSGLGHAAFRLGFFIVFVSGILLLFLDRGTAEQAITLITFLIGLVFLAIIIIWVRLGQRKP